MANRKLWSQEEDQVITLLIGRYGTNQWTVIASEMKRNIPSCRSSKQIRERWYNQLSPQISKTPWKSEEERELFAMHGRIGNKWKQIARLLSGRTDNAVKNHFYSTVRRALRRMDKHFGFKDSTRKMRNLKPSALTYFLETTHTLSIYSDMMSLIMQFAQWKPTRQNKKELRDCSRQIYEQILQILNGFKQTRLPLAEKEKSSETRMPMENYSTESGELSFVVQEAQCQSVQVEQEFNYFGSQLQLHSWFNMNGDQAQLIGSVNMGVLCEQQEV